MTNRDQGFSLPELLCVLVIMGIVIVLGIGSAYSSKNNVGGGERILNDFYTRISERRTDAIRMNSAKFGTSLDEYKVAPPPLVFDSQDLSKTASLIVSGTDKNFDFIDDDTGMPITRIKEENSITVWKCSFMNNPLIIPDGWKVVVNESQLTAAGIPVIGNKSLGQGVPVYMIGFTSDGRAQAYINNKWEPFPASANLNITSPNPQNVPFWSIYFVHSNGSQQSDINAAVAISIHPSGRIEKFHWTGEAWEGFNSRIAVSGN